jgi:hypothetical protein
MKLLGLSGRDPILMTSIFIEDRKGDDTQRNKGHMKMEPEVGVMW